MKLCNVFELEEVFHGEFSTLGGYIYAIAVYIFLFQSVDLMQCFFINFPILYLGWGFFYCYRKELVDGVTIEAFATLAENIQTFVYLVVTMLINERELQLFDETRCLHRRNVSYENFFNALNDPIMITKKLKVEEV